MFIVTEDAALKGDCFIGHDTSILKDFENAKPRLNPLFYKP